MCKSKLAVLGLVAVSLLLLNGIASAGIVDPCNSTCTLNAFGAVPAGGTHKLVVCPLGDGDGQFSLPAATWGLSFVIEDGAGDPLENIPASDFWLVDCDPTLNMVLCGGSGSVGADSLTNAAGETTMNFLTVAAGGCADGVTPVVQGFPLQDAPGNCPDPKCVPIAIRSADLPTVNFTVDADLLTNSVDLGVFATHFPPGVYAACADLNWDTLINSVDLGIFAFHFSHNCNP